MQKPQNWKVKLYALISVGLFVVGALTVMWPENTNTASHFVPDVQNPQPAASIKSTSETSSQKDTASQENPAGASTLGATTSSDATSASPTPSSEPTDTEQAPPPAEAKQATPPPIVELRSPEVKPLPKPMPKPSTCSSCGSGLIKADGIQCPLDSASNYLCNALY